MKTTTYFRRHVITKQPESAEYDVYVEQALTDYLCIEDDIDGRTRRWVYVPQEDRYLRVVVLADGETVHNAMWDRNFKRRMERER